MTAEQLQKGNELVSIYKNINDTLKTIKSVKQPSNIMPTNLCLSAKVSSDFESGKVFMIGEYVVSEEKFKKVVEYIENFLQDEIKEVEKDFENL